MKPINLNDLAKQVCETEGKKKQVDIAQVKEVIAVLFCILDDEYAASQIMEAIERTANKNYNIYDW